MKKVFSILLIGILTISLTGCGGSSANVPADLTKVYDECFQEVKVQFIALGLIQESSRKKSAGNVHKYWSLTPYGNKMMMKLKAIKKR
jgi:hypothetical protein